MPPWLSKLTVYWLIVQIAYSVELFAGIENVAAGA